MKKALKKWLALALALALVLSLAACGGNNTAGNDASSNQQNSQNGDNADAQDTQDTSGAPVWRGRWSWIMRRSSRSISTAMVTA